VKLVNDARAAEAGGKRNEALKAFARARDILKGLAPAAAAELTKNLGIDLAWLDRKVLALDMAERIDAATEDARVPGHAAAAQQALRQARADLVAAGA